MIKEIILSVNNIQAITNIDGVIKKPASVIKGDNGVGKSTLKDIIYLLSGGKANINITTGAKEGDIKEHIIMDDGSKWMYSYKKTSLNEKVTLVNPAGKILSNDTARSMLKNTFGMKYITFTEFETMIKTAEGKTALRNLLVDLLPDDKRDKFNDNLFQTSQSSSKQFAENMYNIRREVNTILKSKEKALNEEILTNDEIDMLSKRELAINKLSKYKNELKQLTEIKTNYTSTNEKINIHQSRMESIKEEIKQLEERIEKLQIEFVDCKDAVDRLRRETFDIDDLTNKITTLEINIQKGEAMIEHISVIKSKQEKIDMLTEEVNEYTKKSEELTNSIEQAREENKEIIGSINLHGLTIDGDDIYYNNIPIEKSASSERKKLLAYITKASSSIPLLIIDDGEGINKKQKQEILDECIKNDILLIFCEYVENSPLKIENIVSFVK
jgi:DNA repair ATPase RecN